MTEQEFYDSLKAGEWSADFSKHRYGSKIGYKWHSVNKNGVHKEGIEKTKIDAETKARKFRLTL